MAWNQPSGPNNPWGRRPGQGGPDLDGGLKSWQRRLEAWLRPGGRGGDSGSLFLIAALVVLGGWVFSGFYQVEQAQRGIIQRFGKLVDIKAPGVGWRWPWPIETVTKVNVANVNSSDFKSRVLTSDVNLVELHFAVQLLHRIRELVLNREVQLDQVYVGGQHPGLEVARVHVRDVDLRNRLDGPGPAPSDPRGLDVDQLPEALDDAALGLLDLVEAAEHPAAEHHERRDQEQRAAVPAAAPGPEPRLEPALPALQALVQIRSPLTGTASPRIVRTAWLIPGHRACANSAQLGRARDGGRL